MHPLKRRLIEDRAVQGLLATRFTDSTGIWQKCARRQSPSLALRVSGLVLGDVEAGGPFAAYAEESQGLLLEMVAEVVIIASQSVFDDRGLAAGLGRDDEGRFLPEGGGGEWKEAAEGDAHSHLKLIFRDAPRRTWPRPQRRAQAGSRRPEPAAS